MLLWLALAMLFPTVMYLLFHTQALPFRVGYGLIGPLVAINAIAIWFLLIILLGLEDHKRLVRWTWIIAGLEVALDLVEGMSQVFDWTTWPPLRILMVDMVLTIPAIYLELWGLVLVFAAFGKRLDLSRWMLASAVLLADLVQAVRDTTGLGQRWTHWTMRHWTTDRLVTLAGVPLNLQDFLDTFLLIAILYAAWRFSLEQIERQRVLELEMQNARAVQQVLIPEQIPAIEGFTIDSVYKPAGEVGGDFFQILPSQPGGVILLIGDVSGKGMPAAMTVSLLVGMVRALVNQSQRPGEILAAMNALMLARSGGGFTTCLVVRVDRNGLLLAANAGHLSPYRNGKEVELENGLPLGLSADAEYAETSLQLDPQDSMTFLTDGVVEARSAEGELFGFDRTQAMSREPAEKLAQAAQAFGQDDDITVLTMRMAPLAELQSR